MKTGRATIDPFALIAIMFIAVSGYIVYSVYIQRHITIFTTEEQIQEAKVTKFGFIAEFL